MNQSSPDGGLLKRASSPPNKVKSSGFLSSNYLKREDVERSIEAARLVGRHALRDSTLVLLCYRHALRTGELIALRWGQICIKQKCFNVERLKGGTASIHSLEADEIEALTLLRHKYPGAEYVFVSERQGTLSRRAVHTIISRAGRLAGITFPVHPYMLRHARGFELGSGGMDTKSIQAYFGHCNIQHTAGYIKSLKVD